MATNHSEFALHVTDKKGNAVCVLPGQDFPEGVKVDNPYVLGEDTATDANLDGPPPKAGRGSGEDKWRAYAEKHGVDVTDVSSRDDIIDRLVAEGVPVE